MSAQNDTSENIIEIIESNNFLLVDSTNLTNQTTDTATSKLVRSYLFESEKATENFTDSNISLPKLSENSQLFTKWADYNYAESLVKSIQFYYFQRSGNITGINSKSALAKNSLKWRANSGLQDYGINSTVDLVGGFYDAGDHLKLTFPLAYSITILNWGLLEYWDVYESLNLVKEMLYIIKHATDYLQKANPKPGEIYVQVGNVTHDHNTWEAAESIKYPRYGFKTDADHIGTDVMALVSAAFASSVLVFERFVNKVNPIDLSEKDDVFQNSGTNAYIRSISQKSKECYYSALETRPYTLYHIHHSDSAKIYKSSSYRDDLVFAGAWLYRMTGNQSIYEIIQNQFQTFRIRTWSDMFSWDDVKLGTQVLIAQLTKDSLRETYLSPALSFCQLVTQKFSEFEILEQFKKNKTKISKSFIDNFNFDEEFSNGKNSKFTRKKLYYQNTWAPLRYSSNTAFICGLVHKLHPEKGTLKFIQSQIDYILGSTGVSYQVGFGQKYPLRPHHRGASCADGTENPVPCGQEMLDSQDPNKNLIIGAIVGGPSYNDSFLDYRQIYESEVALDYNAGFQGALAGLIYHKYLKHLINVNPKLNVSLAEYDQMIYWHGKSRLTDFVKSNSSMTELDALG